jgi:hypothetical protein
MLQSRADTLANLPSRARWFPQGDAAISATKRVAHKCQPSSEEPTEGFYLGVARPTRSGNLNPTCRPVQIAELAKEETSMTYSLTRRSIFIGAATSLICAPSIVRASRLMPIRSVITAANAMSPKKPIYLGFAGALRLYWMKQALKRGWDEKIDGRTFGGISERQARDYVAYMKSQGTLPPPGARVLSKVRLNRSAELRRTAPLKYL